MSAAHDLEVRAYSTSSRAAGTTYGPLTRRAHCLTCDWWGPERNVHDASDDAHSDARQHCAEEAARDAIGVDVVTCPRCEDDVRVEYVAGDGRCPCGYQLLDDEGGWIEGDWSRAVTAVCFVIALALIAIAWAGAR